MTVVINGTTGITSPASTINTTAGQTFSDSSVQNTAATGFGFKNRIINGAMMIDQRNAGAASANTINGYFIDRWMVLQTATNGKIIAQQNAGSLSAANRPTGFTNYLGITSQSAYSITSIDNFSVLQQIEGFNVADLGWGTANAQTVTLSFWVRSSLTGTFGGAFSNAGVTRSYPFSYTISSANTWELKSVTVAGDTSGTWATDNTCGIRVWFGLGAGSTYSGTAGAWASADYRSATGAQSVVGTNGATFYITGVQLEKGSTATSFDYRPYGTELALCQRYFEANSGDIIIWSGDATTGNNYYVSGLFVVTKRAIPTMTSTLGSVSGFSAAVAPGATVNSWILAATCNSSGARRYFYSSFTASAEL